MDYTWGMSRSYYKLYGIINDDRVKKIQITLENGKSFTQTEFYNDLFLFTWMSRNNEYCEFKNIKGYDSDDKIIFEDKH